MSRFNFDPDRFVQSALVEAAAPAPATRVTEPTPADIIRGTMPGVRERDYRDLPASWASGLRRMNTMDMPRGARRDRWAQLVQDAHRFAWCFHDTAVERGWSIETLFGFNPKEPFQDESGLIFQIRGERVIALIRDDRDRSIAAIGKGVAEGYRYFYQRPIANAQLIWTSREIG